MSTIQIMFNGITLGQVTWFC